MHANVLKKVSIVWEYATSPARSYGRGIGRKHIFNCEMFIFGHNLINFFNVSLISHAEDDTVNKFCIFPLEVREIRRHPINEFFR